MLVSVGFERFTRPVMTRLVCDAKAAIGESPVWLDGRVVWTDPVERRLLTCKADGASGAVDVNHAIWSLALLGGSEIVGSLEDRFCRVSLEGITEAGSAVQLPPGCRLNDMAV